MNKKLVNIKKDERRCEYCKHGKKAADSENILCIKKGVMVPDDCCHNFSYNPLMRVPKKPAKIQSFDQSDFEL